MNIYTTRRPIDTSATKILAVDDEVHICDMIANWLHKENIHCDTAHCVDAAIALLQQHHYDLIISDLVMPGRSGIDLLGIVSETFPFTAMIMATSVDSRISAVSALEQGAFGYMVKPFERNEFIINIYTALERRRVIVEHHNYEELLEQEVRDRLADIRQREEEIAIKLVSASGYRDEETGKHIKRIGLFGAILAEKIGWDEERISQMRIAGPMHDVGKVGIPDEILHKPGKLTPEEFEVIKEHPLIGKKILGGTEIPLLRMAEEITEYHHEKWDGSGYPHGLRGEEIPVSAQIVAVADVYDALSNDRVYRAALPEEKVLAIMAAGEGSHFSPRIYAAFLELLPAFRLILTEHGDHLN